MKYAIRLLWFWVKLLLGALLLAGLLAFVFNTSMNTASVRVLLIDKKHPLLGELRAYLERWFPDWRQCPYLSRMSRAHRLLLSLLGKKRYGLVALLFQLKGRLG